jgi:two-component system OmpR family sensor kinase
LLQISRVDAGLATRGTPVDLVPILELVISNLQAGLEMPGRLSYVRDEDARLAAPLDIDAFAIVVRNLIENAVRHGSLQGQIIVQLHANRQLSVRNTGNVVAPETLAVLPQRFTRGDTFSDGSGLGLAIVASIMQHSGGRLVLHSPARNETDGFEAVLEFAE